MPPLTQVLPTLSSEARPATSTVSAVNERGEDVPTPVAGEHPLTLYLDKRELVTLMTLGGAPEYLALGYLRNQRLIDEITAIASVQVDWDVGAVAVTSRRLADSGVPLWGEPAAGAAPEGAVDPLAERLAHRTVTTGCGQGTVFGDLMADIDAIRLDPDMRFTEATLYSVMDLVRRHESIYKTAGAVHGCALCAQDGDGARILQFVEDVGRHNAVDAIAGWMWTHGVSGRDKLFYTTGRLTSEMVIKCAQMDIPVLLSRSGLTEMGHRIAERVGITMVGRCQGKHYLLFTGRERFLRSQPAAATAAQ